MLSLVAKRGISFIFFLLNSYSGLKSNMMYLLLTPDLSPGLVRNQDLWGFSPDIFFINLKFHSQISYFCKKSI